MDHIITSGSAHGRIAFFDMRANAYISVQQQAPARSRCPACPCCSGDNEVFWMGSDSESDGAHELEHAAIESGYAQYTHRYGADSKADSEADSDASSSSSMFLEDYWPLWSPEPAGHPDFLSSMPEPTASHAYSAQEDPELTAPSRLWLQTSDAWMYM